MFNDTVDQKINRLLGVKQMVCTHLETAGHHLFKCLNSNFVLTDGMDMTIVCVHLYLHFLRTNIECTSTYINLVYLSFKHLKI